MIKTFQLNKDICPECGSTNYTNAIRGESCDDCGYFVYYP